MKKLFRPLLLILLFLTVFFTASCSQNTENEHLPEYCQTYSGFTSIASKDFYDLLREQSDIEVNRFEYIEAISQISLEFIVDNPNREIDLSGIQCFQNLTDLTLIGSSFKDLSPISALSNIQSIELNGTSVVSIDSFKNLSKIKSLVISDTRTLQSVEGIEEMTKLTNLDLSGNGIVVIDGLNNLVNLETLYLNDNDIISFPSINQLDKLRNLDISDNNINQLGEDLSGLISLTNLTANNNEICDLSTLDDLISLEILNLNDNDLGCVGLGTSPNFDSLENSPNLSELYLDNNNLTSIEGLRGRDINLEILHISDNNLTDITPIGDYTGISDLILSRNNISNIDNLSGMIGLINLDLSNNSIGNFSNLLTIPNVVTVNLSFNDILTIPDISESWPNLSVLDLSSNDLTDTSGVEGHPTIESLVIYNNGLTELRGISDLPELDNLVIFDLLLELELDPVDINPNNIRILRNSFNNLESLELQEDNIFDFGFELGSNIEIYNSINGLTDIASINFTDMDIDIIDEFSINLPNLQELYVDENNLTDISFILGNPSLERLFLSNNMIGNLEVINGVNTSDLDSLEQIFASGITADNSLVDSFILLPSLLEIDLSNTSIVSISNSFNDLTSLNTIDVDADNLLTIEDSFNNIFGIYDIENSFDFDTGKLGVINNSFNGGIYNNITITNQSTLELITKIEDSFNNIEVRGAAGIVIESNDFTTISSSFNNIDTELLSVSSNKIEVITDSFIDSTFVGKLDLSENLLETVPSLNQLTSVVSVDLNDNVLTTLNFVDTIPDITTLDISLQQNKTTSEYTLGSIDGINNMPTLTTIIFTDIGITSIDGLRNLGINSFELPYTNNSNKYIESITSTSFFGTPITYLDLDEYELDDITFIDNFDVLENLYIGINLSDLSRFQGQDFENTLEVLVIENSQNTLEFDFLSNYDALTNLTFTSPTTTIINNLDGMDSLVSLALDFDQITTITGSFNELPELNVNSTYLEQYSVLQTISSSFDIYGDADHSGIATITANLLITDSFNNLDSLIVVNNEGDFVPKFDTLSFDNITNIVFESGNYDSLAFLNGYAGLTDVTFTSLGAAITDLANDSIINLHILSANTSIDTFILDLNSEAYFELRSLRNGQITITGDFINYNLNAVSADMIINSTASLQIISADIHDMTINSNTIVVIELGNYTTENTTLNINSLASVDSQDNLQNNTSTFTINTLENILDISVLANNLVINDDNATTYTINNLFGDVVINNSQTGITLDLNAETLDISHNSLEELTLNGAVGIVTINSTNLNTVTTTESVIDTINIDSNQEIMTITGSEISMLNLTNNLLNNLSVSINTGDLNIISTNNELVNASIIAHTVVLSANSIPSIVLSDTSTVNVLDLTGTPALSSLSYGVSSISTIDIVTSETSLAVSGSTSIMTLSGSVLTDLTIVSPQSSVVVGNTSTTLDIDVNIGSLVFEDTTLGTLNINSSSELLLLRVLNSSVFSTLNANDATIDYLSVVTDAPVLNIDAANSISNSIEGSNLTSLTANLGSGSLSLESINNDELDLNIIVGGMLFGSDGTTNSTDLIINSLSNIDELTIRASSLNSINSGTAVISDLIVSDSSPDLTITGTEIVAMSISDMITSLEVFAKSTTTLNVNSTSVIGINLSTNTANLNLTAIGDTQIISDTLENAIFELGINDIGFIVNKSNLDFTIDGTANKVTIEGDNVDSIVTTSNTIIGTLKLNDTNVVALDFTTGSIENLDMTSLVSSISIIGDELRTVKIDGANLSTIIASSSFASSSFEALTGNVVLNLNVDFTNIDVTNDNMTTIDLTGTNAESLLLKADSLSSMNTATSISNVLEITTSEDVFSLNTSAPNILFSGKTTGTLNLENTNLDLTVLDTNTDILNVDSNSSSLSIDGANLNQINGNIVTAILSNTIGTLVFDLAATGTLEINNDTVTSLVFSGIKVIDELDIKSSSAITVNTGAVDINTLKYEANANNTVLTSNSEVVELSTSGNAIITLNYGGDVLLNLQANVSNSVIVNLVSASSLDVEGEVTMITITGANIDTVFTELLTVYNTLKMNGTLIDDLNFISTDVLVNVDTIEINTLSNVNIDTIMTIIDNSYIDLISPIEEIDVFNYYYDAQVITLTSKEVGDSERYDTFRNDAILAAWSEILTNEYMDHLDETTTKTEINTQVYQTSEAYFISYRDDGGFVEDDFSVLARQDIVDAIQSTLDNPLLTISEVTLDAQVTAAIIDEATIYATVEQGNDIFTIS